MNEYRSVLERAGSNFAPLDLELERILRRRDRKRRNQRIAAGVVGIAVFVAAVWIVTTVGSLDRSQTSVVPGGDVIGPPVETPPAGTAPETGYLIDLNTGEITQLPKSIAGNKTTTVPALPGGYAVSPDGTMVAYTSQDDAGNPQVFIARLDGTDVRQVTHEERGAADPDWSPDGAAIAYTSGGYASDADVSNISVLDLATGETSQVTNEKPSTETCCDALGAAHPQFSPDGASIVYLAHRGDNRSECWPGCYGLQIVPVTGGKSILLVGGAGPGRLSPDGSTLAVLCGYRLDGGLCIADADGTNLHVLVRSPSWAPTWSPDGTRIAYVNVENTPQATVFVVDVATGETTFVAEGNWPQWLDDQTLIINPVPR